MIVSTFSVAFNGVKPCKIQAQISSSVGVPKIIISGLADRVVRESRERIFTGIKNQNIKLKSCRTVINLMPTDLNKNGNHLELAMAVGIIGSQMNVKSYSTDCFIGAIGLDGSVQVVPAQLALVIAARQLGFSRVFLAKTELNKVEMINDLEFIGLSDLNDYLKRDFEIRKTSAGEYSLASSYGVVSEELVKGGGRAVRALQIAAAGKHHLLMIGAPGYGKTMLAQSLAKLLPPLSYTQALEVSQLYSLFGQAQEISTTPPFRYIHNETKISDAIGSRNQTTPTEATLAKHGVLFLDEIQLIKQEILQFIALALDQNQAQNSTSRFLLVAAGNPCKCGFYGTNVKPCACRAWQRQQYTRRLSGSILDRFDLYLEVNDSLFKQDSQDKAFKLHEIQQDIWQSVELRRKLAAEGCNQVLLQNNWQFSDLSQLPVSQSFIKDLRKAQINLKLSNRAILSLIAVARTISLLEQSELISRDHLLEALSFRLR